MYWKCNIACNTNKLTCKTLLFQVQFGLGFYWKHVAYHFIPSYSVNDAIKEIILEILQKCHQVDLNIIIIKYNYFGL